MCKYENERLNLIAMIGIMYYVDCRGPSPIVFLSRNPFVILQPHIAIVFIWVWWNNIVMVVIWVWGTNSESGFCEDLMVWLGQGLTTEPNSPSNPIGDHWRFLKSIETDFYHIGWNEEITIWNCAQNKSFLRHSHSYSPCCGWLWCEGLYVMLAAGPGSIIGNIPNWRYNTWWTI